MTGDGGIRRGEGSVSESLEVQGQYGRYGCQFGCFGGLADLAAFFAFVSRIEVFDACESLEGFLDGGEGWRLGMSRVVGVGTGASGIGSAIGGDASP